MILHGITTMTDRTEMVCLNVKPKRHPWKEAEPNGKDPTSWLLKPNMTSLSYHRLGISEKDETNP